MKEHFINQVDNFISGWYHDSPLWDNIINFHKNSKDKFPGVVSSSDPKEIVTIDKSQKYSIDCNFAGDEVLCKKYSIILQEYVTEYIKKYEYCSGTAPWGATEIPNIQYYPPGGGYFRWHCERLSGKQPYVSRHLVFMTYLNDVTDDGETEFYYQKIKIKPEKGLTLIWPGDWTYTHRGIPSQTQEKYILTGWFSFGSRPNMVS